ncbi:hypothetical protein DZF91_21410 [Actinomadura logoneensis]|uniref:DUF3592 domain-containing protein n=1 Tax=Actinomadura logoneensis TaxID=2293572 RepID=A0A372JHU8_9ACTN|nr:hypothetical protein DZF91_21410 [Actinomadura logoneensis]
MAVVFGLIAAMVAVPMSAALVRQLLVRGWSRRGGLTVGIVVRRCVERATAGPPTWQVTDVRYSIVKYADRDGNEHTVRAADLPVGEFVRVVYDPRHPHRAFAGPDDGVAPLAVVGGGAALLAAGLLLWGW